MKKATDKGWFWKQRQKMIEIVALWTGRVNTRDLTDFFGVTRQQASLDINDYVQTCPNNLYYSRTERFYLAASSFNPHYTRGVIDEYLAYVHECDNLGFTSLPIESLPKHPHYVNPRNLQTLLASIRAGRGVMANYRSMQHPDGSLRVIHPHSIVYSGFRWHVRAFCELRQNFLDFNLTRFADARLLEDKTPEAYGQGHDEKWNKIVTVRIGPNPNLSEQERVLLDKEFNMSRGVLAINSRACLVQYVLQAYQVDLVMVPGQERKQRLVLLNKDVLSEYLLE